MTETASTAPCRAPPRQDAWGYVTKPGGQVSVQIRVRGAGCSRTEVGTGWRLAPREAGQATLKG